jgi:hypothetical protein
MATTQRQTAIFGIEDWKQIYQTYREADFQSYDFETLRKSFIDYLRLYYPETFNDYVESSEFIALLDVMAFMGQALAFRNDLNTRENYIDTAERRDSVVRLANLVSYTAKRNLTAEGQIKVVAVSTTENVFDYAGLNLANLTINWNDPSNPDWLEQFTAIINASLVSTQSVGRPGNSKNILGVLTDEYTINLIPGFLPIVPYNATVDGVTMPFELVNSTMANQNYVYEPSPRVDLGFNIIYKNDQLGYASVNTGYFFLFKQGTLQAQEFNLPERVANRTVNINIEGINNTDRWLYQLDTVGDVKQEWTYTENVYTAATAAAASAPLFVFSTTSRTNDQITLVFGDGVFAEIPVGSFRCYVRASNGLEYIINPEEMNSVTATMSYTSRIGRTETITFTCALQEPVSNSQARESITEIKQRAPAGYYTQNRMVNGEDYNLFPFTQYSSIVKSKAVVRSSIGTSRFLELIDPTGKYASTNVYASDGALYRQNELPSFNFDWVTVNDIANVISSSLQPLIQQPGLLQFYYQNYPRPSLAALDVSWVQVTAQINQCSGYFIYNNTGQVAQLGPYASNFMEYVRVGALIKFVPPAGYYFDQYNNLKVGVPVEDTDKTVIWAAPSVIILDGTNFGTGVLDNGVGAVILDSFVPDNAIPVQVIPLFKTNLNVTANTVGENITTNTVTDQIRDNIRLYRNFGLGYNNLGQFWYVITSTNLDVDAEFNIGNAQSTAGTGNDASWLIQFITNGTTYTVTSRQLNYYFGSVLQTRFFFRGGSAIYDPRTGTVLKDFCRVLKSNSQPGNNSPLASDITVTIVGQPVQSDGVVDDFQVSVSFQDNELNGLPDNPDFFTDIVAANSYVFLEKTVDFDGLERYLLVESSKVNYQFPNLISIELVKEQYLPGQIFYAYQSLEFYELSIDIATQTKILTLITDNTFIARTGRPDLAFQYRHNAPLTSRIDPTATNIIDVYIVTQDYYTTYQAWLKDTTGSIGEPTPPNIDELNTTYQALGNYKMISDQLVLNSVQFKPLFGTKASTDLRATIKVIPAKDSTASESQIKNLVITALNDYFNIDNWNFGDTFYFSELSAYIHANIGSDVSSVVLVPVNPQKSFGDLYEIRSAANEIFVNAATVNDVEVIAALTSTNLRTAPGSGVI